MFCKKCGKELPDDSQFCLKCGTGLQQWTKQSDYDQFNRYANSEQTYQHVQPTSQNDSSSTLALVFGLLALLTCGIIFGPLAIAYGSKNPGNDTAKAGKILGIVALILWGIGILFYIGIIVIAITTQA